VEGFTADSVAVRLVNVSSVEPRTVALQAGAYGEHEIVSATAGGKTVNVNGPVLTVKLGAGAGDLVTMRVKRYANEPTLRQPWDRE